MPAEPIFVQLHKYSLDMIAVLFLKHPIPQTLWMKALFLEYSGAIVAMYGFNSAPEWLHGQNTVQMLEGEAIVS